MGFKMLEINSQISTCKNLGLFRDFARKRWPLRGSPRTSLINLPLWKRGIEGDFSGSQIPPRPPLLKGGNSVGMRRYCITYVALYNNPCWLFLAVLLRMSKRRWEGSKHLFPMHQASTFICFSLPCSSIDNSSILLFCKRGEGFGTCFQPKYKKKKERRWGRGKEILLE